jgi:hypothetical protein
MQSGVAKGQRCNRAALERLHVGERPNDLCDFMRTVLHFIGA